MTPEQEAKLITDVSDIKAMLVQMRDRPHTPIAGNPDPQPRTPIDPDLQDVFGQFYDDRGRALITGSDATTWVEKQKAFEGFTAIPQAIESKVAAVVETFASMPIPLDARARAIKMSGRTYLVFPELPGVGYGTPQCFMVGASVFEMYSLDRAVEVIQQRRVK